MFWFRRRYKKKIDKIQGRLNVIDRLISNNQNQIDKSYSQLTQIKYELESLAQERNLLSEELSQLRSKVN